MELELEGRVAVVTGGSLGIGRAIAETLSRAGAAVVITSRRAEVLAATAAELGARTGREVVGIRSDATDTASVRAMVAETLERVGPVEILVNGAAAPSGLVRNALAEAQPELLLEDIDTKVVGYLRYAQAVAPSMRERGYGRIVNIGGLTGRSSHAISGLRNVAVSHLGKSLSDQLGPDGVTVNTIHPGVVETDHIRELYEREAARQGVTAAAVEQGFVDRTPIRRTLSTAEVADLTAFLCSPRAAAVTGESIGIDGGLTRGIFL